MELNEQELTELKSVLGTIRNRLPENQASYIWNTFNKIRGEHEVQPCMCQSSAGHWVRAMDTLRNYVSNK